MSRQSELHSGEKLFELCCRLTPLLKQFRSILKEDDLSISLEAVMRTSALLISLEKITEEFGQCD